MKANQPSLIFYFSACMFTILFNFIGEDTLILYTKSLVVPSIFIYYLVTNNYKIELIKAGIFLFSFIGDFYSLTNFDNSETGAVLSFLIVYILLIVHLVQNIKSKKFKKINVLSTVGIIVFIAYLAITILSLEFEKMDTDFSIIIIYSMALSVVICISLINYITKNNFAYLSLVLMSVCLLVSDVFYVLNGFYLHLSVFSMIEITMQVFSYFFMVNYFIANDKALRKMKLQ